MTPHALIARLRATLDPDEKRALAQTILDLGYPWALELDAEDVAQVRARVTSPTRRVWLSAAICLGALSLGLASGNLTAIAADGEVRQTPMPATARDALVELNESRVARFVTTIKALLREDQRASAQEAALRCLVVDHPSASRCAELYVVTLDGMDAARAQAQLREASDVRVEMMAFIAKRRTWPELEKADGEPACAMAMREARWPPIRADGDSPPPRASILPSCATDVLAARLEDASRGVDGWNLHGVLVWQDAMETATLAALERSRLAHANAPWTPSHVISLRTRNCFGPEPSEAELKRP